jgi:hypothetical protein
MRNSFLLLAILGIVAIFPQYAFAQVGDDLRQPDVGILPDSPFYNFKLFFENLQEAFTFNQERRAEIILEHAELRRAEVDILEFRMIPIPERVIEIHDEKIAKAVEIIERLEAGLPPQTAPAIQQIQIDQSEFAPSEIRVLQKIDDSDDEQTIVDKLRDRLSLAFSDNQVIEIKTDFQTLRAEEDPIIRERLADELDREVNNPIVNISCFGIIDTLEIANAPDPVDELQDQCLFLKPIPTDILRVMLDEEN